MDDAGRLLRKALRNLYRVVEDPEFWTPGFCQSLFEWCSEQVYESTDTAIVHCQIALDVARKTGDSHTLAKAHGMVASAYRLLALLSRCETEIHKGLEYANSCPCCLAVLDRCLGNLRLYEGQYKAAIACYDGAIRHCRTLGNDDGVGRTLTCRGIARWKLGEIDAALEDEQQALQLLAPDTPEFFYLAALTNKAAFLATGEDRHFAQAEPFLNEFRNRLVGIRGITLVRICLSWIHGLILARLGERERALQMLRKTRLRLLRERKDAEVVAITADISSLYCDTGRYRFIVELVNDSLSRLGDVSGTRALLRRVLDAAERELEETRRRLAEVRRAVNVLVPPLTARPTLESIVAP